MGRKYAKPPLVEAVCEIRLSDATKWDLTVAGLLYEKLRKKFPISEPRLLQVAEIQQSQDGVQQKIRSEERVFFFNEARNAFVQVGARMLAVNCLKPYPEWDGFRGYVDQAFGALKEIVPVAGVNRLGLRYINRIEIPNDHEKKEVNLEAYFDYYPFLGQRLPRNMVDFVLGVSLPYGSDACKIILTGVVAEQPNHLAFSLDLDYSTVNGLDASPDKIDEWVGVAHDNLESAFEGCINDSLRVLFEEVK